MHHPIQVSLFSWHPNGHQTGTYFSATGFKVRYFIADAPMLTKILAMAGHSGFYGCVLCMAKGITCRLVNGKEVVAGDDEEANHLCSQGPSRLKSDGGARVYTPETANAELWTQEKIIEVTIF